MSYARVWKQSSGGLTFVARRKGPLVEIVARGTPIETGNIRVEALPEDMRPVGWGYDMPNQFLTSPMACSDARSRLSVTLTGILEVYVAKVEWMSGKLDYNV